MTAQTQTIDTERTQSHITTLDGVTVAHYARYGRRAEVYAAKTNRGTLRCQASGKFGIGQCENTGKPETVAILSEGRGWHDDTDGWYAVPEQDGAVTLHFCGTHSPTRKAREHARESIQRDYSYAHRVWLEKLKAVTSARDARVHAAERAVLAAARLPGVNGDELVSVALTLRSTIRSADTEAAAARKAIEAEEPVLVLPEGI